MKIPGFFLLALFVLTTNLIAEEKTNSLVTVIAKALKDGTDANLNAGFATTLGIAKTQVSLKRLTGVTTDTTNSFNVSLTDRTTVILIVRKNELGTFYLTDASGKLKRAIINNSTIRNGGLTNIPTVTAQADFQKQVEFWLKHSGK